jgi:hypothetical protein
MDYVNWLFVFLWLYRRRYWMIIARIPDFQQCRTITHFGWAHLSMSPSLCFTIYMLTLQQFACTISSTLTSFASSNLYTVLGEWSNAVTDCAQWLNGRGVGARWDGTWYNNNQVFGSCSNWTGDSSGFSADYKTFLRKWVFNLEYRGVRTDQWIFVQILGSPSRRWRKCPRMDILDLEGTCNIW